jgi:NAD(P)-dependent dehydrogenase (short-subunit alcohol dehydrogenase family)
MPLTIDLKDRVALVTGVTDGIGVGIARKLAEAGCNVAGCARRPSDSQEAQRFVSLVESYGRQAFYIQTDLSQPEAPQRFVDASAAALGRIDVVVSNAGRNVFEGIDGCTEDSFKDCIDLDLASHWRLGKAARPHLDARTGSVFIINSSNHAFSTLKGCFPYNVAKAGLVAMTQSMALEWGPKIRAVCIAPGFIDTPGGDAWFSTFADPAAKRASVEQAHPVGRIGTPDEIGGLCAFLASEYAAFISGSTILVDGGHAASMGW